MSGLKVHHLNCATMCPVGFSLFGRKCIVCHCLLVESNEGLVLVDTGLGTRDVGSEGALPKMTKAMLRPALRGEETALRQVEALGFRAEDVRHVVLTHLDFDHAGGLSDFPKAAVHLHKEERAVLDNKHGFSDRMRYCPEHVAHGPKWHEYLPKGEPFFGFEAVRELEGLPPEILLVPLQGHSPGHSGVAVESEEGWLLHAGDAYFHEDEVHGERGGPWMLNNYQRLLSTDDRSRRHNQKRLRGLAGAGEVQIFCSHDAVEFERFGGEQNAARQPGETTEAA